MRLLVCVRQLGEPGDAPASSRFRVGGVTAVEAPRKHGPFDPRWPRARTDGSGAVATVPFLRVAEAVDALDWDAFSNRSFRERLRHDSEARSASVAYRQGRKWGTAPARLSLVSPDHVSVPAELEPEEAGPRRLLAAMAAGHLRGAQEGFLADQT